MEVNTDNTNNNDINNNQSLSPLTTSSPDQEKPINKNQRKNGKPPSHKTLVKKERFQENLERIKSFEEIRKSKDKESNKMLYAAINDGVRERKLNYLVHDNKCTTCWLLNVNCICPQIKNKIELKHEYIFCFHPNEWTKASNTGKVVLISDKSNFEKLEENQQQQNNSFENTIYNNEKLNNCENDNIGTNSKIFIIGERNDEELFFKRIAKCSRDSTFVLFPSQNSVNIKDVLKSKSINLDNKNVNSDQVCGNNNNYEIEENEEQTQEQDESLNNDITTITETIRNINFSKKDDVEKLEKLTIIIADGTWRQAKSINKRIPEDITRIHLEFGDLKFKSMFNSLRSQPQVDRISTLEATIISMKSLGESDEVCDKLVSSLQLMIDTLVRQSSKTELVAKKKWVGDSNVIVKNKYNENIDSNNNNDNNNNNNNTDKPINDETK
ncbi:hypothetical protein DICPUDRAFT_42307 [Dictyostelium purpureum]|uniref:tRNA-uridine aminocarboxypropyltransferase n=1 Tax=Dictyostelium purpureum TaxID=5786 RepID=F1A1U1_DICPU|nr:uncharacterized protein DICPUDRAFT_42307 [Dictyostelium purpureum]EGC29835.1 hypothetical protein DICPUDRAFT_42307 [Dictyostelium purpureum]|eukprot:XP_003293633.1 hypothetical protein DICPUDRAFT_42307 [Dictyostelium purpureum]